MPPIPCAHCAKHFMRHDLNALTPKLCNSCKDKEEKRNPKKEDPMTANSISILIHVPQEVQADIEEYCINNAVDFSQYFLALYNKNKEPVSDSCTVEEPKQQPKKPIKK